jgi:hypothetical protein
VKEGVFYVELMNGPMRGDIKRENNANNARFDDMTKGLVVIDPVFLRETTNYPASLVESESAVGVILVEINPFATNHIGARGFWNKSLSMILAESILFQTHGSRPMRVSECLAVGAYNRRDISGGVEVKNIVRLNDTVLEACAHASGSGSVGLNRRGIGIDWGDRWAWMCTRTRVRWDGRN